MLHSGAGDITLTEGVSLLSPPLLGWWVHCPLIIRATLSDAKHNDEVRNSDVAGGECLVTREMHCPQVSTLQT